MLNTLPPQLVRRVLRGWSLESIYLVNLKILIAVSSATTSTLVDDAAETLYYTLYVLWDLVGVDDEGTRRGR